MTERSSRDREEHRVVVEDAEVGSTTSDLTSNGHGSITLALLVGLSALVLFWRIGERPLLDWEEARYAQVAREMLASGNWVDLSWNSTPYFNKPPLLFWAIALSVRTFGESEWAVRLPGVLCGIGSVGLLCMLARQLFGQLTGFYASFLLLTLYPFLTHGSRQCAPDALLLFWSLLALLAFWRGRQRSRWLAIVGPAIGASFLTKGIAAFIPLLVMVSFCVWQEQLRLLRTRWFVLGSALGLLLAVPWYVTQLMHHGHAFYETFVVGETLTRVVSTYDASQRSVVFYLETLGGDVSHILPLFFGFVLLSCCGLRRVSFTSPSQRFVLCWLVVTIGAVASTQTRHAWYLLPIYPPLCVLLAALGTHLWQQQTPEVWRPWASLQLRRIAVLVLIGYVGLTLPQYARSIAPDFLVLDEEYRDRNAVLHATRDHLDPTRPLHVVGPLMPGAVFYSQHPVVFVPDDAVSELLTEATVAYVLAVATHAAHFDTSGFVLVREQGNWSLWERGSLHETGGSL